MSIVDFVITGLQLLATIIIGICVAVIMIKVIWNIGLPYAMLTDSLRRKPEEGERGWSVFPLIELVPLGLALLASALSGQSGLLSPWQLLRYIGGSILLSYVHFLIAGGVCGFIVFKVKYHKRGNGSDR
jgi:hypothetical protein